LIGWWQPFGAFFPATNDLKIEMNKDPLSYQAAPKYVRDFKGMDTAHRGGMPAIQNN
jgi:hypothetical protein